MSQEGYKSLDLSSESLALFGVFTLFIVQKLRSASLLVGAIVFFNSSSLHILGMLWGDGGTDELLILRHSICRLG